MNTETRTNEAAASIIPVKAFIKSFGFLKGLTGAALVISLVVVQLSEGRSFHQGMFLAIAGCVMGIFMSVKTRTLSPLYFAFLMGALLALFNPQEVLLSLGMVPGQH